jgi:hypothetical protein
LVVFFSILHLECPYFFWMPKRRNHRDRLVNKFEKTLVGHNSTLHPCVGYRRMSPRKRRVAGDMTPHLVASVPNYTRVLLIQLAATVVGNHLFGIHEVWAPSRHEEHTMMGVFGDSKEPLAIA